MLDAIVIGGGISGLVCGHQLLKRGHKAVVLEARRPGGLVFTKLTEGFTLECGPNVFIDKPAISSLIDELALASSVVRPVRRLYRQHVWHQGRPERVPKDPVSFAKTILVDGSHKLPLLKQIFFGPVPVSAQDDCSVAEFFLPLLGPKAVGALLAPALKGIYGGSIHKLSARSVFPQLWESGRQNLLFRQYLRNRMREQRGRIFTLRGGISSLAQALIDRCQAEQALRMAEARSVSREGEGFSVLLDSGETLKARQLFVSTSGPDSARYLDNLTPALAQLLRTLSYVPLVVLHFAAPKDAPVLERSFGILFPTEPRRSLMGVMFNSELFPHVAPPDKHLITVMVGGSEGREVFHGKDEEILSGVKMELMAALGLGNLSLLSVTRWQEAIPEYLVGHYKITDALRKTSEDIRGLHFLGTDLGLPGVADRVAYAIASAAKI